MTRRYAKFIPATQQSIANKAQEGMNYLLKGRAGQVAKSDWYTSRSSQPLIPYFDYYSLRVTKKPYSLLH